MYFGLSIQVFICNFYIHVRIHVILASEKIHANFLVLPRPFRCLLCTVDVELIWAVFLK